MYPTIPGFDRGAFHALAMALATFAGVALTQEIQAMNETPTGSTHATGTAVVELRQYTLHPFKRDVLIDLFEHEFVESQEALGIRLIGTFRDLANADRFVWLRGFEDMPTRADALQAFYSGPVWQAHRNAANATMIDSDNVLLLRSARPGSGFRFDDRPLAPREATRIPAGLVEVRTYYFDAEPGTDELRWIDGLQEARDAVGASLLAVMQTESSPNTFARLPVRENEPALVVFSQFRDARSHARYLDALAASPQWRRAEGALLRSAPRAPDILELEPTARSRLP